MKKQLEKTLGNRLTEAREALGYTSQNEFAAKTDLSSVTIYKIEKGENKNPNPKTYRELERVFGINPKWLMTGEGEMLSELKPEVLSSSNPWKDEAYSALKSEVTYLREMLKLAMGGKSGNFLKALEFAGLSKDNRSRVKMN